jgi:hypothetical protein
MWGKRAAKKESSPLDNPRFKSIRRAAPNITIIAHQPAGLGKEREKIWKVIGRGRHK